MADMVPHRQLDVMRRRAPSSVPGAAGNDCLIFLNSAAMVMEQTPVVHSELRPGAMLHSGALTRHIIRPVTRR